MPVAGGEPTLAASASTGTIGEFALSADGARIAFQGVPRGGNPVRSYDQPELFVAEVGSAAAPRLLTGGYDADVGGGLTGDQRAPRGSLSARRPSGAATGGRVVVRTADRGRANLQRVDLASGKLDAAHHRRPGGDGLHGHAGRQRAWPWWSRRRREIGDLFVLDAGTGAPRRLTGFNEALFSELQLGTPEEIVHPSFDGTEHPGAGS